MSCHVRVGPTIEKAELPPGGVIDGKSGGEFGDAPRPGKAAGHVEILRGRKPRRTDDAQLSRLALRRVASALSPSRACMRARMERGPQSRECGGAARLHREAE